MIWKCEIQNSYVGKNVWTEVEIVGNDFLTELRRRFGNIKFRNVQQYDYVHNRWVPVEVHSDE